MFVSFVWCNILIYRFIRHKFALCESWETAMDESQKVIRITKSADEKLVEIARRKHLSKSKVATRIITHYYSSNIGVDLPSPEDYKSMVSAMSSLNGKFSKIIGPVERTEDFIKSLVREDRRSASGSFSGTSQDMDASDVPALSSDDRLPRSLGLLERLFSIATRTTDFEGHAAMQIRLSQSDFNHLKREYEELCTSRSI